MKEIWKDVIGFEGYYQVSNLGRVKSLDRIVKNRFSERVHKSKILKPVKDKDGYNIISLSINSLVVKKRLARLVGETFLGLTSEKTIDHINFDTTDDRLVNIKILNHRENSSYTRKNKSRLPIGISVKGNRFEARKSIKGKRHYIGLFKTVKEAEKAYLNFKK